MRIWNWIVGLFRRRNAQDEPPREPHLDERYTRDAVAASAARAAEAGINAKGPPPGLTGTPGSTVARARPGRAEYLSHTGRPPCPPR